MVEGIEFGGGTWTIVGLPDGKKKKEKKKERKPPLIKMALTETSW